MAQKIALTAKDVEYLDSIEAPNGGPELSVTVLDHQYARALDHGIKVQLEEIYKRVIDPKFVLSYHCGTCVFDMLVRVYKLYREAKASEAKPVETIKED